MKHKRVVVVGDGECGKTSLIIAATDYTFMEGYKPTIYDGHNKVIMVGRKKIDLNIVDTAGQEGYDRLRFLLYDGTDIFLVCYSINSPDSFHNIPRTWMKELKSQLKNVPFILVACKKDLRDDPETLERLESVDQKPVTTEEGESMAQQIGAQAFVECSAKTREGIDDVFYGAVFEQLKKSKSKHKCRIS